MSKFEKLFRKLKSLPSEVLFIDIEKVLNYFEYKHSNTSGSHVKFKKKDKPHITIVVHHNKVKKVYIKEALKNLKLILFL